MSGKQSLKGYVKVAKKEEKEQKDRPANELHIGSQRSPKHCISQAIDLLENGEKFVMLKGRGVAVNSVVSIAEVVKRRVKGLHQLTEMESLEVVDEYEPKNREAGLENVTRTKYICGLSITLSLDELDTSAPGYQEPVPESEVIAEDKERRERKARAPRAKKPASGGGGRGGGGGSNSGRGGGGGKGGGRGNGRGGSSGASRGRGGRGGSAR